MAQCPRCKKIFAGADTTCPDDGAVLIPDVAGHLDPELKRGQTVGEYVIEGVIGSGTFGVVYRAIQPLIAKQVAIKVLSRKYSLDPQIVSRFIAEARAVNQIQHKNIIDIFSFGQLPDGRHYHIMEFLSGDTLEAHLRARDSLTVPDMLRILQGLARALDAAHAAGIAHRDLKPANVFVGQDDEGRVFAKLLDFGVAKLMTEDVPRVHHTATGAAVGTPDYMSPEQCRGPDVDHRTDIYSFGVMTYQMLTGRLPFIANTVVEVLVKQMREEPLPPSSVNSEVHTAFDTPVLWMLKKNREDRPSNLAMATRALEQAAEAAGHAVTRSTGDSSGSGPRRPAVSPREYPLPDTMLTASQDLSAPKEPADAKKSLRTTFMLIAGMAVLALIPLRSFWVKMQTPVTPVIVPQIVPTPDEVVMPSVTPTVTATRALEPTTPAVKIITPPKRRVRTPVEKKKEPHRDDIENAF